MAKLTTAEFIEAIKELSVLELNELVKACEEAGVKWLIVEQDDPSMGRSRLECAEMSIRYLKSFL